MVLDAPWPGSTRVSGGSLDSRFKDAAMSRLLPPRKSVRPYEPAKSVSPENSTFSHSRHTEPGVWPGVEST